MNHIWIVEDDVLLSESYGKIISESGDFKITQVFNTGEAAIQKIKSSQPDIIMMDIELPGMSGVECTRMIKRQAPEVQVIMVTVHEDSRLVFEALKAGASGYITKGVTKDELVNSLCEIATGGSPMSTRIAKMVIESFHVNQNSPLTKRESEILKLVAAGNTFTQIAEQLFIARETTKTHIRNIYNKLAVNCRADALAIAKRENLI